MAVSTLKKITGGTFRTVLRALFVFPVYPLLWIVEPFLRIRLCIMPTQRFGELAGQMDYFTRMLLDSRDCRETYLLFGWDPSNEQLFKMFQRLPFTNIYRSKWGVRILSAWSPLLRRTRFWYRTTWDWAEYALFDRVKSPLAFTPEEEAEGRKRLAEMGIGPDDWYVCFHARDNQYLRQWRPNVAKQWEEHLEFKNTSLESYFPAIEHIVSKGGLAVRFGAAVTEPLPDNWNGRVIDYSSLYRSDFMDIYLLAHARFFLCTSSGPQAVAPIFNVPVLTASHFPYTHASNQCHDLVIPRLIVSSADGKVVPFYEALRNGFYAQSRGSTGLDELGNYELAKSTPDEILDGCKDMISLLEGGQPEPEVGELQTYYSDHYLAHLPDNDLAARIAPSWAVKHRTLFVDPKHDSGAIAPARTAVPPKAS